MSEELRWISEGFAIAIIIIVSSMLFVGGMVLIDKICHCL
jgi:hypothetical protein